MNLYFFQATTCSFHCVNLRSIIKSKCFKTKVRVASNVSKISKLFLWMTIGLYIQVRWKSGYLAAFFFLSNLRALLFFESLRIKFEDWWKLSSHYSTLSGELSLVMIVQLRALSVMSCTCYWCRRLIFHVWIRTRLRLIMSIE